MNPLMWLRLAGVAGLLAGLYGGYQYIQNTGYAQCKIDWDADTAKNVKAQADKTLADAAKLNELEETKNANLAEISRVYYDLGKSERLHLPKAPCLPTSPNPPGEDTVAASGVVPSTVSSRAEEALAGFDRSYRDEANRADRTVEDCRVAVEFEK